MSAAILLECTPNDWPESVSELRTIDNLLRCSICFEYFNIAVTIPECSHNYCSLCIRRSLNYETQCPTCATKATERDLKNNRVLDHLVMSFTKIREKLLEVVKGHCNNNTSNENTCKTPKKLQLERTDRKREKTSPEETAMIKKRKRMKLENIEVESSEAPVIVIDSKSCSPERESSPSTSETADLILVGVKTPARTKKEATFPPKPHSPQIQENTSSDVASCPVCGEMVLERTINSHLDACLMRSERKETLRNRKLSSQKSEAQEVELKSSPVEMRKLPATEIQDKTDFMTEECSSSTSLSGSNSFINPVKKRKTLPKLVLTLLNDKQLRKKLKEFNLSTHGTRETLIKRYQEFVLIYNSQCDSLKPKSVAEIARQVEKQEKTKTKLSFTGSRNVAAGKNQEEEEKEKNRVQYLKENEEQFQQLISDIRKRDKGKKIRAKKKTREIATNEDAEKQSSSEENLTLSGSPISLETRVTINDSQNMQRSSRSSRHNQDVEDNQSRSCDGDDNDEQILGMDEGSRSIESFSVVPEPLSTSSLESLGDDDSDSNYTPSLGLGREEESDEDDNMEESENESSPSLLLQSSFDAPDVIPESPVIGCSKAGPGGTNLKRDIYTEVEQLTDQKQPPRSKRKLALKNSYR